MAPIIPIVLRVGMAAVAGYTASRLLLRQSFPARRDQRFEDGFDELEEGLAYGRSLEAESDGDISRHDGQFRLRREIGFGARAWQVDLGAVVRLKVKRK